MGFAPTEVDRQSLWQFAAAWNGYVAAHAPDKGQLTERQAADMFAWIDAGPLMVNLPAMPVFQWDGRHITA